jgi:hypothetical protein
MSPIVKFAKCGILKSLKYPFASVQKMGGINYAKTNTLWD